LQRWAHGVPSKLDGLVICLQLIWMHQKHTAVITRKNRLRILWHMLQNATSRLCLKLMCRDIVRLHWLHIPNLLASMEAVIILYAPVLSFSIGVLADTLQPSLKIP